MTSVLSGLCTEEGHIGARNEEDGGLTLGEKTWRKMRWQRAGEGGLGSNGKRMERRDGVEKMGGKRDGKRMDRKGCGEPGPGKASGRKHQSRMTDQCRSRRSHSRHAADVEQRTRLEVSNSAATRYR